MIGRSSIVGLPLSLLLGQRDATVTVAHSRTQDLQALIREADVVISAVGQPGLVTAVKTGAFVIDVGINRLQEGASVRLVGDVDMEAVSGTAGYLTPVPGGVGPMTVACLMHNTLRACEGG
jgi:methylenetetrahydrofolate dehydrogenase (NADP+)/methenyltetrahydrofolate cyclohydrolase